MRYRNASACRSKRIMFPSADALATLAGVVWSGPAGGAARSGGGGEGARWGRMRWAGLRSAWAAVKGGAVVYESARPALAMAAWLPQRFADRCMRRPVAT